MELLSNLLALAFFLYCFYAGVKSIFDHVVSFFKKIGGRKNDRYIVSDKRQVGTDTTDSADTAD